MLPSPLRHGLQSMWCLALPTCQPFLPALALVSAALATLLLEKPWEHSQHTRPPGEASPWWLASPEASVFPTLSALLWWLASPPHPTPAHPSSGLPSAPRAPLSSRVFICNQYVTSPLIHLQVQCVRWNPAHSRRSANVHCVNRQAAQAGVCTCSSDHLPASWPCLQALHSVPLPSDWRDLFILPAGATRPAPLCPCPIPAWNTPQNPPQCWSFSSRKPSFLN